MYFKQKASGLFPGAVWTGGSGIHASIAWSAVIPLPFDKPRLVMSTLEKVNFGMAVLNQIQNQCPGLEWIVSGTEFQDLMHVDYYRMLHHKGALITKGSLTNPVTGNVFHKVALLESEKIAGGIRVWIGPSSGSTINMGWRFRLEEQTSVGAIAKIREKTRILVQELTAETVDLKTFVAQESQEVQFELEHYMKAK